jgi:hypothetical protein
VRQVGDVGNIPAVLFAVEDVDVIVLHQGLPEDRLYRSIRRSNCRTWYAFAFPRTFWRFTSSRTPGWMPETTRTVDWEWETANAPRRTIAL